MSLRGTFLRNHRNRNPYLSSYNRCLNANWQNVSVKNILISAINMCGIGRVGVAPLIQNHIKNFLISAPITDIWLIFNRMIQYKYSDLAESSNWVGEVGVTLNTQIKIRKFFISATITGVWLRLSRMIQYKYSEPSYTNVLDRRSGRGTSHTNKY